MLRGILPESKYHATHGPCKYAYERHPPPDVSDFEGVLVRFGIRVRYTGLSSSCNVRTAGPKKLKILQLFMIGSQVQLEQKSGNESPCAGSILFRSDPVLIFLSENQP